MIKVCPLFSGSGGNCTYIGDDNEGILVDAGKNAKQIEIALNRNNIEISKLRSIFITHEHNDHVSGLRVFASRYNLDVFASCGTVEAIENMGIINGKFRCTALDESGTQSGNMVVRPFRTSHDARQSFGYKVEFSNGKTVAVCTDLGFISDTVEHNLNGCITVVIESNHDVDMLKNGAYPYFLKRRILSETGHLSNDACAKFLPKLVRSGTKNFVLSHLSSENNFPELAYRTVLNELNDNSMKENTDFTLSIAPVVNHGTCCVCM